VPAPNNRQVRIATVVALLVPTVLLSLAPPRAATESPATPSPDQGLIGVSSSLQTTPIPLPPTPNRLTPEAATAAPSDTPAPRSDTPRPAQATARPATQAPAVAARLTLGVWSGQPWEPWRLDAVTALLGRSPLLYLTYVGWDRPFTASDEDEIARRGATHVVTWEPNGYTLASIANGDHDAFIRDWARGAASWGGPIYLRPMHEMNGDWYDWGRGVNGNTAADFIHAWRHMHDIFVAAGASNVKWVWSPNVTYGSEYPLHDLYPGNAYVDWLGLDGYNWGLDPHLGSPSWQSFSDIFAATYREVTALAPGKSLMIAETASTENGGDKAQWILSTFMQQIPRFPAVRAAIWFNEADGASDFRINSSPSALAAFRQVLNSPLYGASMP
jgi:hypothetical protein